MTPGRNILAFLPTLLAIAATCIAVTAEGSTAAEPFASRGYYVILSRIPTLGLPAWRRTIDGMKQDGANLLILWVAGAFKSRKYPVTWQYNRDHQNILRDFVRPLIDHAHRRGIRVLLGFTPFGYDGVNQYSLEHPDLIATGPKGEPVPKFGFQGWGYNLCPSRPEAQQFMREYVREMFDDFYPNADGLFIESSDYGVCQCSACVGRYFEKEFSFVREISEHVWSKKPGATIVVYPHYFSGKKVSFADATAAKMQLDPRWTLFFTPHSARVEPALAKRAAGSLWWNDGPAWLNIERIQEGARQAKDAGCSGYIPSIECFTYVPSDVEEGEPWVVGKRLKPFGFGWLKEGETPYYELPIRVARLAYREFTRNPEMTLTVFKVRLGRELFGQGATWQEIDDALTVTAAFGLDRGWTVPPILTTPELVRARKERGQINPARLALYRTKLEEIENIADRYPTSRRGAAGEMGRIARWILQQWSGTNSTLLDR